MRCDKSIIVRVGHKACNPRPSKAREGTETHVELSVDQTQAQDSGELARMGLARN